MAKEPGDASARRRGASGLVKAMRKASRATVTDPIPGHPCGLRAPVLSVSTGCQRGSRGNKQSVQGGGWTKSGLPSAVVIYKAGV